MDHPVRLKGDWNDDRRELVAVSQAGPSKATAGPGKHSRGPLRGKFFFLK